jgi:prevent-host-death family protein
MSVRTLDITEATEPLAEYAQRVDEGPLVVTVDGRPIAVVVGLDDADLETVALSSNPEFLSIIERSRARYAREGGISSEEMRRLFDSE